VKVKDLKAVGFEILDSPNNPVAGVEIPRGLRGKQEA
jgi:hypothetical protein